ncbi:hypothetical protein H312_03303 [Anncaliia algerae PRA339]|uniref:Uncharacterized protein n=1 Tax=Anncaliia algerae PRA339 TaxID=1288291 RepID=A0A059EX48_9MICR|nr:hypothetical protein H312_03303 [Anncaliia algerae PRA339]
MKYELKTSIKFLTNSSFYLFLRILKNKIDDVRLLIQIAESMLNYKIKNHRSCSPDNMADCIFIVESANKITRACKKNIPKKYTAILSLIAQKITNNSVIFMEKKLFTWQTFRSMIFE